jgi:cysteine synthase B
MPVQVRIPTPLRKFTGGAESVPASGATVAAIVQDIEGRHPGLKERICDDAGKVRRFVNVYVNGEDIRFLGSLDTPVKEGDEISIVPAIAGVSARGRDRCRRQRPAFRATPPGAERPQLISSRARAHQALARDLPPEVRVYAKLEGFNPGGSVKDRPALNMVRDGIRKGLLQPGKTILDSTSGNTGIALAMIGAALGYPVELVMPENVSIERKKIIRAYGASIIFSSPLEGSDGAIRLCREVLKRDPEKYFKPDQYFNEANPEAHYLTTGPEIWRQTDSTVTRFVTGLGTGAPSWAPAERSEGTEIRRQVIVEPDDASTASGLEAHGVVDRARHLRGRARRVSLDRDAYDTVWLKLGTIEAWWSDSRRAPISSARCRWRAGWSTAPSSRSSATSACAT